MPRTKAVSHSTQKPNGRVEFDPEKHIYRYNGQKIPSTTQVLSATGISFDFSKIDPYLLARKRALGLALHACLHFYHQHDLDWESLDPEVRARFSAYELFVKDTGFIATSSEIRLWPLAPCGLRYGMQADVTGLIDGEPHLPDFKTAETQPQYSWAIQTALYETGIGAPLIPPFHYHRSSLQLFENGRYKWTRWTDPGDFEEGEMALKLTWRRINRGEDIWR